MSRPYSAALPITYVVLRILIVVNWLGGAAIATLLFAMPTRQWIMSSLGLSPGPEAERVIMGLRAIAAIGLAAIPLNNAVLKRLSHEHALTAGSVANCAGEAVSALQYDRLVNFIWIYKIP